MKNKQQPPRSTSWGRVAGWYEQNVEKDESYHATLLLPNLLRLISVKKGERMVELGCGSGFFCERFAAFGAEMVGVDLSKELIAIAQQRAQKQNLTIRYHAGSAEKLGMIAEKSIDTTVIVLAIQNMRDIRAVFAECSRVLKKNGRLVLVMNHPAFRIPKYSSWGWDAALQYRRIDRYLSEISIPIQMHPGKKSHEITTSFHRSLQAYAQSLREAGFGIVNLEEWISNKKSTSGPRAKIENVARGEFPLFLYLEAKPLTLASKP